MQKLTECGKNPMGLYEVCRGDTAESVAARLGVTAELLVAVNGLKSFPPAGTILLVPVQEGEEYVVSPQDSVASLCERFGMSEEEFFALNGVRDIYPTQRIRVTGGRKDAKE